MAFGSVLQHNQHNIGRAEPSVGVGDHCAGCNEPILDKFLLNVSDRRWHATCVRCCDCLVQLTEKCFSRDAKLYCKKDFFRRYGTKCNGCGQGISPSELVRKSRDNKVFHLKCLTCFMCRRELCTGDQLYIVDENKFMCKEDYLLQKHGQHPLSDPMLGSGSEDEEDDEPTHHIRGGGLGLSALVGMTGNGHSDSMGPMGPSDMSVQSANSDSKITQDDSDQGSIDGDPDCRGDSQAENKSPDDGANGSKRRGPRTTIKAKQLDVLKNAFSQTPKPTRHIREQLAKETGLPMRVIQVWFQNKRSKERRLKQLTSMGRGPFFGGARKMRGFPMNLSPGMDDAGFPFYGHDGKFEFGYGGPQFHPHADGPFFPGHPIGPIPFNGAGGPMDHPNSMPMVNDFGGMGNESNFMNQNQSNQNSGNGVNGPGGNGQDHLLNGQRTTSPSEFMGNNNFSEPQNMQSEGLVW